MLNMTSEGSKNKFLYMINTAHINSGRSLREAADLNFIHFSHLSRILSGLTYPSRDVLISLCWSSWNLDIYQTDEILHVGGYKTIINRNRTRS